MTAKYYIGSTKNLAERIKTHECGKTKGIRFSKSIKLVFYQEYADIKTARKIEYRLKRFKSRKIIEKIIPDQNQFGPLA